MPESVDRAGIDTLDASSAYGELRFPVTFYDHNLVVLPEVTEEAAAQMVDDLARRGEFDWLLKDAST
ncbi:hypothetical protein [Kutzneria sp. 744]|uniref:hypothetical protein n=1 Tax=Kutzneria sp. (strain 744) TaxID=345341 RepID=UPI0004BB7AA8|nr:hypothetical protein [Kutzneria sp. 744]